MDNRVDETWIGYSICCHSRVSRECVSVDGVISEDERHDEMKTYDYVVTAAVMGSFAVRE